MDALAGPPRSDLVLAQLAIRNRVVGILRLLVPLAGAAVVGALLIQIFLANLERSYGVAGLKIDRGNLVVQSPRYSGTAADGARYLVKAREARAALGQAERFEMVDVTLDFARPGKSELHASATGAQADLASQTVTIPGVTMFYDDGGLRGTLTDTVADMGSADIAARGPVDLSFADGAHLTAESMRRVSAQNIWDFTRATLVVPDLPRAAPPPIPFAIGPWVLQ